MLYDDLMKEALWVLHNLPIKEPFEAKDLFRGVCWKALEKSDRLGFGEFFKRKVVDGDVLGVRLEDKAGDNHSVYVIYDTEGPTSE